MFKKTIFFFKGGNPDSISAFRGIPACRRPAPFGRALQEFDHKNPQARRRKKSRPIFAFSRYGRGSTHNGVCPWKNSKMGATENAVVVVVVDVLFFFYIFFIPFNSYGFFIIIVVLPSLHHATADSSGDYVHHSCFRHTSHGRFLGIPNSRRGFFSISFLSTPPLLLVFYFYLSVFLLPPPMHRCTLHGDDLARALCHRIINF